MRTVETSGKTIEDAKKRAASELGVAVEDVEFEVLDVGAKGVFGFLGGSPARVRATYYETRRQHREPVPRAEGSRSRQDSRGGGRQRSDRGPRDDRRGSEGRGDGSRRERGPARSPANAPQGQEPRQSGQRRPPRPKPESAPQTQAREQTGESAESRQRQPRGEAGRSGGGGQPRQNRPGGRPPRRSQGPAERSQTGSTDTRARQGGPNKKSGGEAMDVEQAAQRAVALVQSIVDAGNLGGSVRVAEKTDDGFEIEVEGGDTAVLAGNGGQALDALQFLVGIIVNRNQESKARITLEADGLRRKHKEMLESTALELAGQVAEHNQEAELEPLPARDRRIIHNVLKDHPTVMTYSEGEGENRRVIISPKETQPAS